MPPVPRATVGRVGLASITRRDGERSNTIAGFITASVLPATVLSKFQARLEAHGFTLPPGYRYAFGGEADERNKAVGNLLASVGVLLVLMLATLVLSLGIGVSNAILRRHLHPAPRLGASVGSASTPRAARAGRCRRKALLVIKY